MQLSTSSLLQGLGMTENSWFDFYEFSGATWKTLQATAVFNVDKARPTIIRLRPSLLVELEVIDCPGLEELIAQPRSSTKRQLDDMVSPPKKVPRTTATGDVSTQGERIIEILDSPPQSPSIRSHIPLPSTNVVALPNASVQKAWPTGFHVCEHLEAWDKYKQYKDAYGRNKASIPKLWPELFPGSKYVKTTVTTRAAHRVDRGRFFLDAVRARSEGRPTNFAHLVKNEPQADAASASTSAPHILEAPATIPAVVPDPHTFPLAFKPDIPVPVASSSEVLGQPPDLLAFSPDGKHIVSGSDDKTLHIWDAESGAAVGTSQDLCNLEIKLQCGQANEAILCVRAASLALSAVKSTQSLDYRGGDKQAIWPCLESC
ncbi:hypothetical protein B0H14DRAFT_3448039 [Mycena olivaceomarginata]|nr:hypothetical protein B0H14DRAFT_3448039 [Mycena olivaceomarginata]